MSTEESIASFIRGEPIAVEVEAIEETLANLWQAAAAAKDESNRTVERACQLNLLAYSANEGMYERAANVFAEITARHPGRVIALLAEPEAETDEVAAYVSALRLSLDHQIGDSRGPMLDPDDKRVCSEQITLAAKGKAVQDLPGIATSLIIGELPVILWWQDDLPEEDSLFERLLAASNHLIFDSADSRDVGNVLARAHALCSSWKPSTDATAICGDLNWLRLSPCRDLVARFLEAPEVAPLANHVKTVSLEVTAIAESHARGGDSYLAQPLLFLGWLANRLNWKLTEPLTMHPDTASQSGEQASAGKNIFRTNWQSDSHEMLALIKVTKTEVEVVDSAPPAGAIAAITLLLQQNEKALSFSLQRAPDQPHVIVRTAQAGETLTEFTVPFPDFSLGKLMGKELDLTSRDRVYEEALSIATQLV